MTRPKRNIYIAIMRAAARGEGVKLSVEECHRLSFDDAIATRAVNVLDARDLEVGWDKRSPFRRRERQL